MAIMQVVGIGITAAVLIILIRQEKPELAFLLSLVTGIAILILVIDQVAIVINLLEQLADKAQIDLIYLNTILKIVGIAYIGEFGAEITRDAGESALASKIEMAAKIIIMILTIPVMITLIETIIDLIP
ncbi:stage III sporulation protein AD [Halothermothrix orenii]|uniref:Sporulation stage III protein AD n=1 Tax=Halothermothrix orenii (strain H 168 / OCM 544 / DSM 9562) TaxID=373903 RepID=B8D2F0_HALOH|nr:stage III sporulation protein AD [Halothermothrix orenii]ACL69377.1 Sporulation stage III protein AD [Halothermothrix orenii H 168]